MNRAAHLAVILFWGCVWWGGTGCQAPPARSVPPPSPSASSPARLPPLQVEAETLRLKWLEPGTPSRVVWEASVPRASAESARAGATGVFEDVQCVLYEKGEPTTDLRARRVRAMQEQWRVEASEGVYALSRINGVQLQAKEVIWFARQNRLIARGDVRITGKQFTLQAQQVELDTALQVMRVVAP